MCRYRSRIVSSDCSCVSVLLSKVQICLNSFSSWVSDSVDVPPSNTRVKLVGPFISGLYAVSVSAGGDEVFVSAYFHSAKSVESTLPRTVLAAVAKTVAPSLWLVKLRTGFSLSICKFILSSRDVPA